MSNQPTSTPMRDDNRAVSTVIGVVILFGFLILALSLYQVEVVPQQNAETEFQHSGEVRNDLVELRAGILQAGSIDQPQYQTVQLGTTYSTRVFTINPPSPAGTIRTTDPYPITISNNSGTPEGTITIPTRFIEYQPGYNELDRSPTWYDASVLYLDARDNGGGIAVIEDQALVDNGEVQITALQNEFRRSGTGRVTLELRPAKNVTGNIPEGDLTVTIPTRLSEDDWETKTNLPTDSDVYDGVTDTGKNINNIDIYNLTLNTTANNLTVDTVGVQEAPEQPTQNADALVSGTGGGGGGDTGGGGGGDTGGGGGGAGASSVRLVSGSGAAVDPGNDGTRERVTFDLENTGGSDATITGFAVDSTDNSNADRVRKTGGGSTVTVGGGEVNENIRIGDPITDFNTNGTIPAGEIRTVTVGPFQRIGSGNPDVNMDGNIITVTVRFGDGTTEQYEVTAT